MNKFYGWIPHLYPDFRKKFAEKNGKGEQFLSALIKKAIDEATERSLNGYEEELPVSYNPSTKENIIAIQTHCNDKDPAAITIIRFIIPENFRYEELDLDAGKTKIKNEIVQGETTYRSEITIGLTGLILFESNDIDKIPPDKTDKDDREDALRNILREAYFALKKTYHSNIHHETDDMSNHDSEHTDDTLSIVKAEDKLEGVDKIASTFLRVSENNLDRYSPESEREYTKEQKQEAYVKASGFIAFGLNFINIHEDLIPKFTKYDRSLRCCQLSLESLYASHHNEVVDEGNNHMIEINSKMVKINEKVAKFTKYATASTILASLVSGVALMVAIIAYFEL